jgi:hypothetical protein
LEITEMTDSTFSLRLYESSYGTGKYAALSYVWGGPQAIETIKSNIDGYKVQIPFDGLPQTIKDAIFCTHKIGLKYLWVDSLCIIQDSKEDKQREIDQMSRIYSHAHITISAARAKSCDEGFLQTRSSIGKLWKFSFQVDMIVPRDRKVLKEWITEYRGDAAAWVNFIHDHDRANSSFSSSYWNSDEAWYHKTSRVFLAGAPIGSDKDNDFLVAPDIGSEPINDRGWTLQESWLSPRILLYGSGQVIWNCQMEAKCDGGLLPLGHSTDTRSRYYLGVDGSLCRRDGSKADKKERVDHYKSSWEDIVSEFSKRKLTDPADKLDAIGGICAELKRQSGYKYIAGLWRETLVSDLSWYQDPTTLGSENICWNKQRTCPSWSWSSVDGPVWFSCAENSNATVEDVLVSRNETVGDRPNKTLIVEGAVTLKAPISTLPGEDLISSFRWLDRGSSREAFTNTIFFDGDITNPNISMETRNGQPFVSIPEGLKFVELSWGKEMGRQNVANESRGLVLVPIDEKPGTYKRLGFYIVALEHDVGFAALGYSIDFMLACAPRTVIPTEFGEKWRSQLCEGLVNVV